MPRPDTEEWQMRNPNRNTLKTKAPPQEIADRGAVRLGASTLTGEFPPVKQPGPEIADRGAVRLGASTLTGEFPA
jgi:hypothetical protein